ncbi:serum opacification factor [Streptococcus pseudoporcinus]|uniref:Fibronectin-binding protein n=1 Tax=Streptococcus pseudoporcinus TaxID=361101 RepID=A0A4U9YI16_9STRE|nr:serum opacification factor [Streptococcus pseudoporcinus]VTS26333.1 Fibronectin-binding protein [Streptococcus pseudoporcinus]VUC71696.1 Fibronectin-binding protein [Streptococcus pseudoporcinus]VUD00958.1 Fibronectin-binding protein [Streptococcus pseudoporcinus]VUD01241.1 Fibronectin-binding protein [Streptococcus pseudoporcinus]
MANCKYKLRKLSIGLVSIGSVFISTTVAAEESTNSSVQTTVNNSNGITDNSTENTSAEANKIENSEKTDKEPREPQTLSSTQHNSTSASLHKSESSEKTSTPDTTTVEVKSEIIEVDNYNVDKEKLELKITDGVDNEKLIKNRDDKNRDIVDISRNVKVNKDGTLDVTVSVNPKEIDKGAEVIVLLDTSKKMTEDNFNTAKENIKKLVTTLTGNSRDKKEKQNTRNSVRLIDFYREIGEATDLSGKSDEAVGKILDLKRQNAKNNWDWGVDLQGAIHKTREIFNKEKGNGKRQHIVLFTQGEATLSYDIKNKEAIGKQTIDDKSVTHTTPLLPWPFYLDATMTKRNIVEDTRKIIDWLSNIGIKNFDEYKSQLALAKAGSGLGGLLGNFVGIENPLDYILLKELASDKPTVEFNYDKKVGEGYHYLTHSHRELAGGDMVDKLIGNLDLELKKKIWFGGNTTQYLAKLGIRKALENIFYRRNHVFYNHNLSAQAEAKEAQNEGIVFYSFALTDTQKKSNTNLLSFLGGATNDNKFDTYLKKMSDRQQFLNSADIVNNKLFSDKLMSVEIKEEFEDIVTVTNRLYEEEKKSKNIILKAASNGWISNTKENLTWTISKDDLQKAFEESKPLTLTYKLTVDKEKLKANGNSRKKRDLSSSDSNVPISKNIISNTISYTINDKKVNAKKLDDVNLIYSKERLVKKIVNETKREVLTFKTQEFLDNRLPKGQRVLATKGENGSITSEFQHTYIGDKLTDSKLLIKITKNPRHEVIRVGTKATALANENLDIISGQSDPISITEDTQPGMSGQSDHARLVEESSTEHNNLVVGHQSEPVDITEDSQPNISGSNKGGVIEEETDLESILQLENKESDNDSELSQEAIIEEDKEFPQITTLKEDKEVTQIPQMAAKVAGQTPQAPITQSEHQLPQTGDKETSCEAFFTMTALAIIGAAGLVNKKRYDKHID